MSVFDVLSEDERRALRRRSQPRWTEPMRATLVHEAFSDPDWIYERKLDGVRCLAFGLRTDKPAREVVRERPGEPPPREGARRGGTRPPRSGTGVANLTREEAMAKNDPTGASGVDTTVTKVSSRTSPRGAKGQRYLASGVRASMRLWDEVQPSKDEPEHVRDYETVGYVIRGSARLHLAGQTVLLEPGDCWVVPRDAPHRYEILEPFTAVEATSPPAHVHGRDE